MCTHKGICEDTREGVLSAHTSDGMLCAHTCTCRGGFRGGGGGSSRSGPPLSYMKNDVMHTVIYAAFCMLPSLDLQACTLF